MRMVLAAAVAAVLALPAAAAQRPDGGVLVPSRSFDGLRLGAGTDAIETRWGTRHGRCRDCRRTTWYFNTRPFHRQGVGVELRGGRAVAFFTLWQPPGWRTNRNLRLGDPVARITQVYGALPRLACGTYHAFTLETARTLTAFYVVDGKLWGFGLMRPDVPACR
jgi:hypothetical protein